MLQYYKTAVQCWHSQHQSQQSMFAKYCLLSQYPSSWIDEMCNKIARTHTNMRKYSHCEQNKNEDEHLFHSGIKQFSHTLWYVRLHSRIYNFSHWRKHCHKTSSQLHLMRIVCVMCVRLYISIRIEFFFIVVASRSCFQNAHISFIASVLLAIYCFIVCLETNHTFVMCMYKIQIDGTHVFAFNAHNLHECSRNWRLLWLKSWTELLLDAPSDSSELLSS